MRIDMSIFDSHHYNWTFRAVPVLDEKSDTIKIFSRNTKITVQKQVSFDPEAPGISSIEYFASAIASDILLGITRETQRQKIFLDELEGSFKLTLKNPLTYAHVKNYSEKPVLSALQATIYICMDADEETAIALCHQSLELSPIYNTLKQVIAIDIDFKTIL